MKDKRKREGIEMIAINARTSPIELKEPGKLRLVSEENNNKPRPKLSIKEKGSKNLEKVLLIKQPANKNNPIEEKEWAKEVIIPHRTPLEFKETIETKVRFECVIEDKAIIFFKSKYRKQEQEIIKTAIKEKEIRKEDKNKIIKKKEDKINLIIPKIPNFDNKPARYKEIEEWASQWTSGNQ